MKHELLDLGDQVIRDAETLGAQQAEAYLTSRKQIRVQVERGAIKSAEEKHDLGCAIRTALDKKLGFAYTSTINREDIQARTRDALSLAKVSLPDVEFHSFPENSNIYREISGIYDTKLSTLTSEQALEFIFRAVDSCRAHLKKTRVVIQGGLSILSKETAIVNSMGVSGVYRDTSIDLSVDPTIKESGHQASSFEFQISRSLSKVNPEWIGESAARNTQQLLHPKTIHERQLPVIFSPIAIDFLFRIGFADAFNAEEAQMGRSFLADFVNASIAPEFFNVSDNALLSKGNRSRPFDAEGVPSQNTKIISKGELMHFLHNSYTANKAQVTNTGNASRKSYQTFPTITPTNLVITPGRGTLEDLISQIEKGLLCRFTFDRPNNSTGDFSALIMEGFYFDKGEIKHPVKNTLIGINMRDLFQQITLIGADTRALHTAITPSIAIASAKITSG
ncbi:MAG: TldD/PmbA family protein [Candidatus Thorarchaeota archaeon]